MKQIPVYVEIGKKRTFAGALDWPGWTRSGRDEESAIEALLAYAPRYRRAMQAALPEFSIPEDASALAVVERLDGSPTTDFGAPSTAPAMDLKPVTGGELRLFQAQFEAAWGALDAARAAAADLELRRGPRGGGRDLDALIRHVLDAGKAYLGSIGWKSTPLETADLSRLIAHAREECRLGLEAAASGELPVMGPRGGLRWKPRTFVRRSLWHILDHVWEIEDRLPDP